MPQQIDINNPFAVSTNKYSYSADGVKLRVVKKYNSNIMPSPIFCLMDQGMTSGTTQTTDYVGNKIFENNVLDRILVDGGYIKNGTYYFYETDHLGSNRLTVSQTGTASDRSDYYPYGMQMGHNDPNKGLALLTDGSAKTAFKFSGKELDVTHGLNTYDFEARPYDLNYINFWTPDSKTEKKPWISPYVYCSDNPVNRMDPDGQQDFAIPGVGIPGVPYWPADPKTGQAMVDLVKKVGNFIKTVVAAGIAQQAVTLERATTGKNKQNVSQANEKKEATEKTAKDGKDGKTGARTEPKDLEEQLTLEEAQGGAGESFMKGKLKDKKYDEKTGTHDKMRHNHDHGDGTSTEVHYDKNRATGEGSNYKIKDDTNKNSRGNK